MQHIRVLGQARRLLPFGSKSDRFCVELWQQGARQAVLRLETADPEIATQSLLRNRDPRFWAVQVQPV